MGFTLVELLVVLGILVLLTAILLPVFAQVRARSRMTVCTSNLRQLGQAMLMDTEDNNDRFPYGGDAVDINGNDMALIPGATLLRICSR